MENAQWMEIIARVLAREWYRVPLTTPDTIASQIALELSNYGEFGTQFEGAYADAKDWERLPVVRS